MHRIIRIVLVAVFLGVLPAAAGNAEGGKPLLTLVYTANSMGEFQACPVCGAQGQGGLGRRATIFRNLRAEAGDRALFVAGPYEFTPIVVRKPQPPALARALAQAYDALGYDLGAASSQETAWLATAGVSPPRAWQTLGAKPGTASLVRAGVKVGFVLFPAVDMAGSAEAGQAAFKEVQAEARKMRAAADVVVGISPWGEAAERMFLDASPGIVDVLLGAGKGLGFGVRPVAGGRTLWVRTPFDGRGLVELEILALPGSRDGVWRQGVLYDARVHMLEWSFPQAADVTNIFNGL